MNKQPLPKIFTLKNVDIWNVDGTRLAQDVIVQNGFVTEINPSNENTIKGVTIEGNGQVLIPSGVDAHVHLRSPGQSHKETPETGLNAAIKGGYGAVLNMPNTRPPIDSTEVCDLAMKELQPAMKSTGVEVYLSACITKKMQGKEMVDVNALAQWGVKTFTDDGLGVESDHIMASIFSAAAKWNIPVSQHAEYCGHGGVLAGGKTQRKLNIPAYPSSAEYDMVSRDIRELRKTPECRYHVLHVSLGKTVQLIKDAQEEGLKVSCEVTPHHLHYTFNDIPEKETSFKMNPPLRDGYDRHVLLRGLQSGDIAFVATDHAPHAQEEKGEDFNKAAFGTTGMETAIRVLLDMYNRDEIDEEKLVEVFSYAPSIYLGIDHKYGFIGEGKPFNAVLLNPHFRAEAITNTDLVSKSQNNVFKGVELPGKLLKVFNTSYQFDLD